MKLKAPVNRVTGKTSHSVGTIIGGTPVAQESMPEAAWVVIEEMNGAYSLTRYSKLGEFAGDTWHETLEEAKRQARYEFEIQDGDWIPEK
jgi:hypothetical protein